MRGRPTRGWAGHGANGKPYQLTHAENVSVGGGRTGELHATYDAAGGMTALTVRRDGACLPVGATCAQHFAYAWDELGRLVHARRWDVNAAQADAFIAEAPSLEETAALGTPAADLHYVYDSSDQRRLKRAGRRGRDSVNEKQLTLDAAAIADELGLWNDKGKAVVVLDRTIGVTGKGGELTNTVNVYRTKGGTVHACPGSPSE